jgi:HNH endonuclease
MAKRSCTVPGCERPLKARGYCGSHYGKWYRTGDPLVSSHPGWPANLLGNLLVAEGGCVLFTAGGADTGYGQVFRDGLVIYAHRAMYELMVGPIPEGLVLDHTCHNTDLSCPGGKDCWHRRCVNPAHLEAVPHLVNIRRAREPRKATHCPQGHPYSGVNLYLRSDGGQGCRTCKRQQDRC